MDNYLRVNVGDLAKSLLKVYVSSGFELEEQYFGHDGEYTEQLKLQHETLTAFWKVEVPVLFLGLHSEKLANVSVSEDAVFAWSLINGYSITEEEIPALVALVREAIEMELPDGYASPALTFEDLTPSL